MKSSFPISQLSLIKVLLALFTLAVPLSASQINWRSPLNFAKTNYISDGSTMMPGDFEFQLGAFLNQFVPTADNVDEWNSHWVSADATPYNATTRFFASSLVLGSNDPPFFANQDAYIWGFSGKQGSQEWILMKHSNWKWPISPGGLKFPADWNVDESTIAILGSVNGQDFIMKSAAVTIGGAASPAELWLAANFTSEQLEDSTISGWNANPDGDECSNIIEFLTGTNPFSSDPSPIAVSQSDQKLLVTIPVSDSAQSTVSFSLQASTDLKVWTNTDSVPDISSGIAMFPFLGQGYVRINASLK